MYLKFCIPFSKYVNRTFEVFTKKRKEREKGNKKERSKTEQVFKKQSKIILSA